MFKGAKVGDRVWDSRRGFGTIKLINPNNTKPVKVQFDSCVYIREFMFDGRLTPEDVSPRLFWRPFIIPNEAFVKPLPELKKDTKVYVWENGERKRKRHFSHFDRDGVMWYYDDGGTSWTEVDVSPCVNWEVVQDESK